MQILYTIIGYTDPGNNQFVFQNVTKIAQMFMQKLLSHTVDNNRTRVYYFRPDEEMADIVCSYAQAYLNPFETGTNLDLDAQAERIVTEHDAVKKDCRPIWDGSPIVSVKFYSMLRS